MRAVNIIMAILLVSNGFTLAQKSLGGLVNGRVTNQIGEPLPSVNVGIVGTSKGATTDSNGEFEVNGLKYGTYNIGATSIGYETYYGTLWLKEGSGHFINIVLKEVDYDISTF